MRVAVISAHTCPLASLGGKETGGMNVYVRETSRELSRRGIEVDVFTRSQNPEIPQVVSLAPGVKVFHVPAGPEAPYDKYLLMNHLKEFVEGVLKRGSRRYDLIHSHYWISGAAALELRRHWGVPLVHMYHTLGFIKNRVARRQDERERSVRLLWEKEIARSADALVASHPLERAELVWNYEASPHRVTVIPCGVDLSLFRPRDSVASRARLGLEERPWLLFVGRLEPIKGLDTLLRAMAILKGRKASRSGSAGLIIIGGENGKALQQGIERDIRLEVKALGIEDMVFLMGPRPQAELPSFYCASEACILPSRYESFGMVALEAMACGIPVIASRVGGLSFAVREGETGFLIPEGDAHALAEAIERLLRDRRMAKRLGSQASCWARGFGWDSVVDSILMLYSELRGLSHGETSFASCIYSRMAKEAGV